MRRGTVQIKYHPGDLSRIWVHDPFSDQYLEVRAVDQDYTNNISLWKHRVITRYAHEELKRQVNQQALVQAKARIQQLITAQMRLTRTVHTRQGMARWWNTQVTTWINQSTQHTSPAAASHATLNTHNTFTEDEDRDTSLTPMTHSTTQPLSPGDEARPWPTNVMRSVADISAPLPSPQETVVLIPEHNTQTPFEPFPPLPFEHRSLLTTKRRTRRRSTTTPPHLPEHTDSPQRGHEEHEHRANAQAAPTTDHLSSETSEHPEHTLTIQQRQQSFGIEAHSRRWH